MHQAWLVAALWLRYNAGQEPVFKEICDLLAREIGRALPAAEGRIWRSHPVWFLGGNPVAGYSREKAGVRLTFWSGAGFEEPGLNAAGKKFKDASVIYDDHAGINIAGLSRWLKEPEQIQWDYKNLVRRKGRLEPGDVVRTGAPGGVGFARKPRRWLRPGDEVVVEIAGIGALRNPVAAEQ